MAEEKKPFDIKKGGFHEWLGKKEGEPITEADIERALAYEGEDAAHVHKMANFAKNAKKFHHNKKPSTESVKDEAPAWQKW
jgi:hypothetical protein